MAIKARPVVKVTVFRAQDTQPNDRTIPNLIIQTKEASPLVASENWERLAREQHGTAGLLLADALFQCLPGGTIDALLMELLKRRASLFSVRF